MPRQLLLIMVCNAEPVVVNHGLLCRPKVVNHCVLYEASGCDSWCANLSQ